MPPSVSGDPRPFLKRVDLFEDFSEPEMTALVALLEERHYEDGDRIVAEGETADAFYIIRTGQVQVLREGKELKASGGARKKKGTGAFLAELLEGQYFGEAALFQDIRRIASVKAEGPVNVLVFSRDAFGTFEVKEPHASNRMLKRIIKQLVLRLEKTSARLRKSRVPNIDDHEIERLVIEDLGLMRWKI
jgi:CRP/FNR family transcriptional regulator, cyclic AMP receptor protein